MRRLFSYLQNLDHLPPSQACTFFTETQVDIAKQVEKIITSDLRQHHPAWELAARFCVSETSLKNYFRGVYGQNISVYLREIRLKKAAELFASTKSVYLREIRLKKAAELFASTKLSVSEVAEQVGYMNQSKFAAVFKKQYGQTPLEYCIQKAIWANTIGIPPFHTFKARLNRFVTCSHILQEKLEQPVSAIAVLYGITFLNLPVFQVKNIIAAAQNKFRIVRYHKCGSSGICHLINNIGNLPHVKKVEAACWLIE